MKIETSWIRKLGTFVKNVFFTILTVIIGTGLALGAISLGAESSTVTGVILAVICLIVAIGFGVRDLRSFEGRRYSAWKGVRIFLLMALIGALVFGEISHLFASFGWATYESGEVSSYDLTTYYFMILLDLIPGINLLDSLNINMPLKPDGWVAGLMVLLFRAFVVYGVIASFQIWWSNRRLTKPVEST